jgi:hypothetical protein
MDFGYTYAPNLIDQGAYVITEIFSANGYKNLASPNSYEVTHGPKLPQNHFQRVKNYTTSDKIKVRYDYTGRARAHAQNRNAGKVHMCPMRDCGHKKPRTCENDAFMRVLSLPPTSSSASKLI